MMEDLLEKYRLYDNIICIDLKSFFASVECVTHGLDPMKTPLLVADKSRGNGTIVLAVTPYLKQFGVPGRCRLFEVKPKPYTRYYIAKPRMQTYIEYAKKVLNIYLSYISIDDLFVYSIDEAFLDVTSYLTYYGMTARELAATILKRLRDELGLYAAAGIGQNMLMSKFALDIEAKHMPDFISEWTYENFQSKLWPMKELTDVWGIGARTQKKLNMMGIYSMGQLAATDVDFLRKHFGIMGEELYLHAHCVDISKIQDKKQLSNRKGYGIGQTLFNDYFNRDIELVLYEQCQELAMRLRKDGKAARIVQVSVSYSRDVMLRGIHVQQKMQRHTNAASVIYQEALAILRKHYEADQPVRRIALSVNQLISFQAEQPSLFDVVQENYKLNCIIDHMKERFGKNAVLQATSYLNGSTLRERNQLIGGHKK